MLNRRQILQSISTTAGLLSLRAFAQPARFLSGSHYAELPPNALISMQAESTTPLVTEVFWYGCPHCHEFDPTLNAWVDTHGDGIAFSRVPAVWNAQTKQHARLFAVTQELGIHERVHTAVFEAIHEKRRPLLQEEDQLAFLAEHGVAEEEADKALRSFQVDSQVRKAEALVRELHVPGIPALIVRGKYLVMSSGAVRTYQDQLGVVEYLMKLPA